MNWKQASRWLSVLLLVGCNAKLQVDPGTAGNPGVSGWGNEGGTYAGGACAFAACDGGGGASAGLRGYAGGATAPGALSETCVPAGVQTEANGSPAKTAVSYPERCESGLTCNDKGTCIPAPDCPQATGVCVVRRAVLDGNGGAGGAQPIVGNGGAFSASGSSGAGTELPPPPVEAHTGVVSMAASDALYWLEYGTRDSLGNYKNDGALWTLGDDGKAKPLATKLHGPVQLGLTSNYAYVYLDGGGYVGSQSSPQLVRLPLAGGPVQLVQDGTVSGAFAANDKQAFWTAQSEIFTQDWTSAAPTAFLANPANVLIADSDYVYFELNDFRSRAPISGGPPENLGDGADAFTVNGDSLFAIDYLGQGSVLSQAPKSGGMFQRVRAMGLGLSEQPPQFVGDRFFWNANLGGGTFVTIQLRTASLANMDPPTVLASRPSYGRHIDSLWVSTASAAYWSDGQAIYSRAIPPK